MSRLPLSEEEIDKFEGNYDDLYAQYIGSDMHFSEGTHSAALLAAGSVVKVCHLVRSGAYERAFAIVRPPGHHASRSFGEGFCSLNNVAIGGEYLLRALGYKKLLYVDPDIHHGNGTQSIFYDRDDVMFFSIHSSRILYPEDDDKVINRGIHCIGQGAGLGYNVNVNLEGKYGDADMDYVWDSLLMPLANEFNPDIIIVSAGYDATKRDLIGTSCMSPHGFEKLVRKICKVNTGRVVLALEGGYNLDVTAKCAAHSVKALPENGDETVQDEGQPQPQQPLLETTVATVEELKRIFHPYFDVFK